MDAVDLLLTSSAALGTAWGAWLTYRGIITKTRQETHAENLRWMQQEVNRLREDLTERDTEARTSYEEVLRLRKDVHSLMLRVHRLHTVLQIYVQGSTALYGQLREANVEPIFDPFSVQGLDDEDFQA